MGTFMRIVHGKSVSYGRSHWAASMRAAIVGAAIVCGLSLGGWAQAQRTAGEATSGLVGLDLEALMNVEVTSVSGRSERLADAAASIFVITKEDIRRAGVTDLRGALRLAPNLLVARTNANSYAISARGFNNTVGNKLLVLIDGRTVYTPLFSGVFWNAQDVMLEDVDRIEVISGPGATLWGANAVNGVINVITRTARDSQGVLLTTEVGNLENGGAARYGGAFGTDGHFRIYAKGFEQQNTKVASGASVRDGWSKGQVGFRADWGGASRNFTLQGDLYSGDTEQAAPGMTKLESMNVLGRWNQRLANGSDLRVQAYFDRTLRDQPGQFREELDVMDVEFQHALQRAASHRLVWGAGYRHARDRIQNSATLAFFPADRNLNWGNVFVQDEITLRDGLDLTLGVKLARNSYTGVELLPSARLAWKVSSSRLVWGSVSRAVRIPSRLDRELFVPATPPFLFAGGPNFRSEISKVIELGYRAQPASNVSYSVTAFHHIHDRLRSLEATPGGIVFGNTIEGTTSGLETWGSYQVNNAWRLAAGLMALKQNLKPKPGSADIGGASALGTDPNHQWTLRSTLDITPRHEFDVWVRHVGALSFSTVPSYTAVDARLGWRPSRNFELSLTLQNLFEPQHSEIGTLATRSEYERALILKLLWRL
jgi:iron complex outermembrane receptor protein